MSKNKNFNEGVFYLCYLIESIGRRYKLNRKSVVNALGYQNLKHIFAFEDVYHCLDVEQVMQEIADELEIDFSKQHRQMDGKYFVFNNVERCDFYVPKVTEVANTNTFVICRLLRSWQNSDEVEVLIKFYNSRVHDRLENYNTDLFAESPEYLTACFVTGDII